MSVTWTNKLHFNDNIFFSGADQKPIYSDIQKMTLPFAPSYDDSLQQK